MCEIVGESNVDCQNVDETIYTFIRFQVVDNDLDVKTIMDPWMYQMGLPVVNVTDFNNSTLYVSQSRFLNNPSANFSDPPSDYGLVIQLCSTTQLLSILTKYISLFPLLIPKLVMVTLTMHCEHLSSGWL